MKSAFILAALASVAISTAAIAQQASPTTMTYQPYNPWSQAETILSRPPAQPTKKSIIQPPPPTSTVQSSTEAITQAAAPIQWNTLGPDGRMLFTYGAGLPTIFCAPFHVCEVSLQPGESIQQIDVGDPARWQVRPARSTRNGVETTHLIIKPSGIGISSNLIAITDKRTYSLRLVSRKDRTWMPQVAFSYPDDTQADWQAYFARNQKNQPATASATTLDFNYRIKGNQPAWRPVRVYTDQVKTFIQLPETAKNHEIPVLLVLEPGKTEQLVNYRLDGNQFVVDKVLQRAMLVSGIGHSQERVEIIRDGE